MTSALDNGHVQTSEYLYQLLNRIKQRPGMYLGKRSISRLRMLLMGYSMARGELGLPLTEQEKEFGKFQNWIQNRFAITSSQGWDSIILFHATDDRDAFDLFFDLFDRFRSEEPAQSYAESENLLTSNVNS